jgi:ABC-2 type transport system permease protein
MKGLLLKDWYQVRTSMKAMYLTVAFVLVWVFSTSSAYVFPVSYAAVFLGILPVNLLAYDQSVGWVEYGRTLPVSKKTLVAEKYLIGLFCAAAAVVIGGLFVTVIPLRTGTAPDKDVLSLLAGSVCAILLINGISLPLLYRFGAEKASMIYILTFVGLGALLGGGGALYWFKLRKPKADTRGADDLDDYDYGEDEEDEDYEFEDENTADSEEDKNQ